MIKNMCENYLKKIYKLRNMKAISKVKNIDIKDKVKINQYDFCYNRLNKIKKKNESKIVTLSNSSQRFQKYATKNNIDKTKCKDKESVSFLMMMAMLEKGGTAVGVLKEGIFFDNKYKHLRKYCIENFNIEMIVSIDASQFENTSTKTSIIKFSNKGKTKTIKFYELVIDKDNISEVVEQDDGTFKIEKIKGRIIGVHDKFICKASYQDIVKNDYTFNYKKYNTKKIIPGDEYKMVKLGDIVEFLPKSKRKASFGQEIGKYNFYTSSKKIKKCDVADYNEDCLVIGTGGNSCIHYNKGKFSCSGDTILLKYKNNVEYNYYALSCIWDYLLNEMNGSTIKHVTKSLLKDFKIPIPKTKEKMKYWVDRISKPYNLNQENLYQQYLAELKAEAIKNESDKSENKKVKINSKEKIKQNL